jgi:Zn-dependent protease
MNDLNSILFNIAQSLPGFLLAIVVHEAAHAWMANRFGDPTAKNQGRLTLNPAAHYDPWGTIFFPLLAAFTNFSMIGWARPVPIEIRNFKNLRSGIFWVSFAGPLSNLILGTVSALLLGLIATKTSTDWEYYSIFIRMLRYSVFINFILAFFNLIPLPPLDGSKMVSSFSNHMPGAVPLLFWITLQLSGTSACFRFLSSNGLLSFFEKMSTTLSSAA